MQRLGARSVVSRVALSSQTHGIAAKLTANNIRIGSISSSSVGVRRDPATGKNYETDPLEIKFQQMGKFETMDARVQYYMELRGFRSDPEAEEIWKEIYIPLADRMRLQKEQLEQQKREIKEQQSVLDNLKARTSEKKVAVPA